MTFPLALFESIGLTEILLVLGVVLVLFGPSRLPKLARSLGSSMTEFKKGLRGEAAPEGDDAKKISDAEAEGQQQQKTPQS